VNTTCSDCGRVNRPGARFCASCQTPLTDADSVGTPAQSGPLQPGQLLAGGAFRIIRPLGKGGMGAVWLVAQTRAFDRLAVLKEVIEYFDPADAQARQKAVERFETEARILADLKHPGIPDLYAYFSEAARNYLAMEYIEGPDLSQGLSREDRDTGGRIPGAPMGEEQALRYVIQVCEVLEYLAARIPPVVHNDIKPGNIIIDSNGGRAVLVDFGTARTRYLRPAGHPDHKRESVYGTVGYAAPELYQGRSEPRSDVYSLAAAAYHLLTDDDPRDDPSQYPRLGSLSQDLAGILSAALAPKVEDRLTAGEFRQQLEGYLSGQSAPVRALAFPNGDQADGRDALAAQALRHWRFAAGILQDGTLARWLRGTLRDNAAAQAAEDALKSWPQDPGAALDAFLRTIAPNAQPPGRAELRTTSLRLSLANAGQPMRQAIEIANRGPGYLRGEVFSTMPWVRVGSTFGCPPGELCSIEVEVDASGLESGKSHLAAVTLTPAGGSPEVVPVEVTIATSDPTRSGSLPAVSVDRNRVELAARRGDWNSARQRLVVSNPGAGPVHCRVLGLPAWLAAKPDEFRLGKGAAKVVELSARGARALARRQEAILVFAVDGGQGTEVRVSLEVKGAELLG
jgi:serine/threonine protein kinase